MNLRLLDEAIEDATDAHEWYAKQSTSVADAFELELSDAMGQLVESPGRYPRYLAGTRRALLPRFPYGIVFKLYADEVVVIAIAHLKRRPGFWIRRLSQTP